MKKYIIMIDYGLEGWKIWNQCETFDEAILAREEALGNGNRNVIILTPVHWKTTEFM